MNIILERINNVCKEVREKCEKPTSFKKIILQTRRSFKRHNFDISIKTKREKDLDIDKFYVMAYYDSENDAHGETPMEVVVHHNLIGTESFGEFQITNFLIEIYDAVAHEFRHQYQSMRRDFRDYPSPPHSPYEEYLSDNDEIDAYALSITIELLRAMDVQRARRNLGRITIMSKKILKHLETVDKRYIFM